SDKGVNCSFKTAAGTTARRCFPEVGVASFSSLSSSTRFADAACTVAAPRVPTCATSTPAYVSVAGCNGETVYSTWQVSGEVTGYAAGTGTCYATIDKVYLVTEVPLNDWEPGSEMVE